MIKAISKLINDTLKGPNGKHSRKSWTAFVCMVMAVIVGSYIVTSDYFLEQEVNRYAISVFYGFLGIGGGTLGLTVIDKIKNKNNEQN